MDLLLYLSEELLLILSLRSSIAQSKNLQSDFLSSSQRSAEVRALQRALSFYISVSFGVCISAVCGLRFTDLRHVAFSCKQRFQFSSLLQTKRLSSHVT